MSPPTDGALHGSPASLQCEADDSGEQSEQSSLLVAGNSPRNPQQTTASHSAGNQHPQQTTASYSAGNPQQTTTSYSAGNQHPQQTTAYCAGNPQQTTTTSYRSIVASDAGGKPPEQTTHQRGQRAANPASPLTERSPLLTSRARAGSARLQQTTSVNRQISNHSNHSNLVTTTTTTVTMTLKEYLSEIKLPVYVLTMLFAIASWVDINGVWTQLPLMVNVLPEAWNLPSYLTIIIQVANIGPIAYTIANRLAPHKVTEWPVVYVIIFIGAVACALLTFFWDATSYIGGELHSTGLLVLASLLALVDCTSSVVFLPYMAIYKPHYMTAYYIGEGLSGMIPGLVGLGQGVSQDPVCNNVSSINPTTNETEWNVWPTYPPPRFSIATFFWVLFGMIVVSGVSFTLLHFLPYCRTERIQSSVSYTLAGEEEDREKAAAGAGGDSSMHQQFADSSSGGESAGAVQEVPLSVTNHYATSSASAFEFSSEKQLTPGGGDSSSSTGSSSKRGGRESRRETAFYLTMVGVACALTNGVLPAIQSYSCLPYGNLAYTLAVRLGSISNPIACFVALFAPTSGVVGVGVLTLLGSALSGYQIYLAAASPYPPLVDQDAGVALAILTSVFLMAFLSYVKVAVALNLRDTGGHDALLWCGVVTQVGSFVGAIITFICVNVLNLLTAAPACPI